MSTISICACTECEGNCYGCHYADECPQWLDQAPYTPAKIEAECVKLALCESRHEMPEDCDGSIFPNTVDPTDIMGLRVQCAKSLKKAFTDKKVKLLTVYVTGLTVALVEVINWCMANKVQLTLMHFDRERRDYYRQDLHWIY